MTHKEVYNIINAITMNEEVEKRKLEEVKKHLLTCKECLTVLDDIESDLFGAKPDYAPDIDTSDKCNEIRELLADFVEGLLDPLGHDYQMVEKHTKQCQSCKKELETIKLMIEDANYMLEKEIPGKPFGVELFPKEEINLWSEIRSNVQELNVQLKVMIQESIGGFLPLAKELSLKFSNTPSLRMTTNSSNFRGNQEGLKAEGNSANKKQVFQCIEIPDKKSNTLIHLRISNKSILEVFLYDESYKSGIEEAEIRLQDDVERRNVNKVLSTNHEGKATFKGVDFLANNIRIRIKYKKIEWNIVLNNLVGE